MDAISCPSPPRDTLVCSSALGNFSSCGCFKREYHAVKAKSSLHERSIAGASLGGQTPEALKITELRFWLRCRGASGLSKLKTKSDYVQRLV